MKLWLDESRPAPEGWTQAKTVAEAITEVLNAEEFEACSLDHDLSLGAILELEPSGLGFVRWMISTHNVPQAVEIHSRNVLAALRMKWELRKAGYKATWRPAKGIGLFGL